MKTKGYRSGVALITVLVLTGVVTIVLGGVLGYVSSASRMSAYYENKNLCRLAAQSEIELAKAAIDHQFEYSLNRSARIVGGDAMGLTYCMDNRGLIGLDREPARTPEELEQYLKENPRSW